MAKRRVKKRTHAGAKGQPAPGTVAGKNMDRTPKSMVIRIGAGEVGPSVSQLVKDMRKVMEPNTAARLKERRANRLRDYTTMCGPLGISHLLLFSRSSSGNTNLRLARTPRGPTLNFRVESYALAKDVLKAQKHPRSGSYEFLTPPLLVMNNFLTSTAGEGAPATAGEGAVPKHLEKLVTDMFQSLFPPISPTATPLTSIRRVLLLNREPPRQGDNGTYTVTLRHYAITTKVTGLPKSVRRLKKAEEAMLRDDKKRRVNLGRLEDVADYLNDPAAAGYTSASETEVDTDAEVEVVAPSAKKIVGKRDKQRAAAAKAAGEPGEGRTTAAPVQKRAVKLVELGPRMRLRLTKVEEDLAGGKVLWHEFVTKSAEEVSRLEATWDQRKREKEERRRVQRENVERKKMERAERGGKGEDGEDEGDEEDGELEDYDMDDDEWHSEDDVHGGAADQGGDEDDDEEMSDDEE